jgi:GNS1/SUR4 family protein
MCRYYLISTFGYKPWWKAYLTQFQIMQFVMNMAQCVYDIYFEADYPVELAWATFFYMMSLVVLFMQFYLASYTKVKKGKRKTL